MTSRETNGWDVTDFTTVELMRDKDNNPIVMGSDDFVCDAARVSFAKNSGEYDDKRNQGLMNFLANNDHWTPFAHPHAAFRFRAPMFLARQFVKHQVGFVWNEESRRYIDTPPSFFIPATWRRRPHNMKQGSVSDGEIPVEGDIRNEYVLSMREHAKDYSTLIREGICPEQARMLMPQSMMTEWIWTGSLMAWYRFVALRSDAHAQAECWPYAKAVSNQLSELFPKAWLALGNNNA